jgi:hypothetical protein
MTDKSHATNDRDTSRDGLRNKIEEFVLTGIKPFWRGASLLAGGTAFAQSGPVPDMVAVPPGFVAVMVPEAPPMTVLPDPLALQLDAMLSAPWPQAPGWPALSAWPGDVVQTSFIGVKPVNGPVAAEVVTSISDGTEHCTQQLVYPSASGSVKPKVIESGNACQTLAADFPKAGKMRIQTVMHDTAPPAANTAI